MICEKLRNFKIKDHLNLTLYLRIIYILNIIILIVIAPVTYFIPKQFEGTQKTNLFLILSSSFWWSILICSIIGLFKPNYMEPVIIIQIIYKTLYNIYVAIVINEYSFSPYGYVFSFNWPMILIIGVYLVLRCIKKYKKRKSTLAPIDDSILEVKQIA